MVQQRYIPFVALDAAILTNLRCALLAEQPADFPPYFAWHLQSMRLTKGDWSLSVYDLAWVLCCDFFSDDEKHHHLTALLAQQNPDGTWGDATHLPHSALLDTLAVIMALVRLGQPVPQREALMQSLDALIIRCAQDHDHDTVGFSLLVPFLREWLEQHDFYFPLSDAAQGFVASLRTVGLRKLATLRNGTGLLQSPVSPSFSGEIIALLPLGSEAYHQLAHLTLANGAIGLSPAATAATIMALQDHRSAVPPALYHYLKQTFEDYSRTGFPNVHPGMNRRNLWNVLPWLLSGTLPEIARDTTVRRLLSEVYQDLTLSQEGLVSWDVNSNDQPDLNDTAVACAFYTVLSDAGVSGLQPVTTLALAAFQRQDGLFFDYSYELPPSPIAIAHALLSMELAGEALVESFDDERGAMVDILLEHMTPTENTVAQLCNDTWHISWTYGAQRWLSLKSLYRAYPHSVKALLGEVLERQVEGGWGRQQPTLEETSYIVSGLVAALRNRETALSAPLRSAIVSALGHAQRFISEGLANEAATMPPLWISKNLYLPRYQAASSILNALYSLSILRQN